MIPAQTLFLAQVGTTLAMTGLVWFVQVVHYPLFAAVGSDHFVAYERRHARRTSWVVLPLMSVELATALALLVRRPEAVPAQAAWLGAGLLGVIWLSTAALQIPMHARLGRGFHARAHRLLVASNWLRTAAWSARSLLVLWMVARVIG